MNPSEYLAIISKHGSKDKVDVLKRAFAELVKEVDEKIITTAGKRPLTDDEQKYISVRCGAKRTLTHPTIGLIENSQPPAKKSRTQPNVEDVTNILESLNITSNNVEAS